MAIRREIYNRRQKTASGIKAGGAVASTVLAATGVGAPISLAVQAAAQLGAYIAGSYGDDMVGTDMTQVYDRGYASNEDSFYKKEDKINSGGGYGGTGQATMAGKSQFEKIMTGVELGAGLIGAGIGVGNAMGGINTAGAAMKAGSAAGSGVQMFAASKDMARNISALSASLGKAYQTTANMRKEINSPRMSQVERKRDAISGGKQFALQGFDYFSNNMIGTFNK